jgi:hypothetical protein
MASAAKLTMWAGERRIAVIRRHWWVVVRPLLLLIPLIALLPGYAVLDVMFPAAGLARYAPVFYAADLGAASLLLLRWLVRDVAGWYAHRYLLTSSRLIEQRGLGTVERREAKLSAVLPPEPVSAGRRSRLLDYGDVQLAVEGREGAFVLAHIAHPEAIRDLVAWYSGVARRELEPLGGDEASAIRSALTRVFRLDDGSHESPTVELERVTGAMLAARRALSLLPDEALLFATRRHGLTTVAVGASPLTLVVIGLVASVALNAPFGMAVAAICLVVAGCWLLRTWMSWAGDLFVVTTDRVAHLRRGLFRSSMRGSASIREIEDVVLLVSAFRGRILDVGDLRLELRGRQALPLSRVPRPQHMHRLISEAIGEARVQDDVREKERLAGTLADWFDEYYRMQAGSGPPGAATMRLRRQDGTD